MIATTYNYAKDNLGLLIEQAIDNSEQVVISRDNLKSMILMPLDEFNSWQETLYLLSNPYNTEHIFQSIHQAQSGKVFEKELIEP
ncbi:MAG: type II toxin-antitoxin system prevent-host-death family antitoxin [Candidatus Kapabacteria bacterium]|nr:type II toxin-antitoxin system prevent-host-death family antitoxin [Candidatus Kapabacteria bacterium]